MTANGYLPAALLAAGLAACQAVPAAAPTPLVVQDPPPVPDFVDADEWLRLASGEWLKGELVSLTRGDLEFDSSELGSLTLDWDNVTTVITQRTFTVVRDDRSTLVGAVHVENGLVHVLADGERSAFPRQDLMRLVRVGAGRRSAWSGRLRLSGTVREGNTDQLDTVLGAEAERRTATTRITFSLDHVFSEIEDERAADNQTAEVQYDVFLSPRFFLTPIGVDLLRDPFQNIALRATPYTGLGYTLVDRPDQSWDVTAAYGYQHTRFDSVEPGEDESRETTAILLGSAYQVELTRNADLELGYQSQIGLQDEAGVDQEASLRLTFDFIADLDFDVRLLWHRVGQPQADDDGELPERDDLRLDVGLSWEF